MIDVTKVKSLREKTGAGVNECCKALDESNGDLAKAESWLKSRGIEKAAKKEGRETKQGIIESYIHNQGKIGVLVELNCETDFVARTDDFKTLAHELAMQISAMDPKNVEELLKQEYIRDPQLSVGDLVKQTIAKIGENIQVARFSRIALGE